MYKMHIYQADIHINKVIGIESFLKAGHGCTPLHPVPGSQGQVDLCNSRPACTTKQVPGQLRYVVRSCLKNKQTTSHNKYRKTWSGEQTRP